MWFVRGIAALWFGSAGALPGIAVLQIDVGEVPSPSLLFTQVVLLPGLSAALWGALLGPSIVAAGNGWRGAKRSLGRGSVVVLLSLPTWTLLAVCVATLSDAYPAKLIIFAAAVMATAGGVLLYPIGMAAGWLLWRVAPLTPTLTRARRRAETADHRGYRARRLARSRRRPAPAYRCRPPAPGR